MNRIAVTVLSLSIFACHGAPPEGVYPCTAARDCPPLWYCRADMLCWSTQLDAGTDGAGADVGLGDSGHDAALMDANVSDMGTDAGCTAVAYYPDCDNDGFTSATATFACSAPTAPPCAGGRWTTVAPTTGMADCADAQAMAFPGSMHWDTMPAWSTGAVAYYDWNCDGRETLRINAHGLGPVGCALYDPPPDSYCDVGFDSPAAKNWNDPAPTCGQLGHLQTCPEASTLAACAPTVAVVLPECQ